MFYFNFIKLAAILKNHKFGKDAYVTLYIFA